MLLAGAIVSIYNIINKTELLTALKQLLVILIIFYILGIIVKDIFIAAVVKSAKKTQDEQVDSAVNNTDADEEVQADRLKQDNKSNNKA
jgi:hypothetical protein